MTTTEPPACWSCVRYNADPPDSRRCTAFGDKEIPARIWDDLDPHTSPIRGDGGETFLPFPDTPPPPEGPPADEEEA